jgi:hypothetical protein
MKTAADQKEQAQIDVDVPHCVLVRPHSRQPAQ